MTNSQHNDALSGDSLIKRLSASIKSNWETDALSNIASKPLTYGQLAAEIARLHVIFSHSGIKKGDKIAICGKNSYRWAVAFLSALTYGAVSVPILHEFKSDSVHHLINHSEARLLFVDTSIWSQLDHARMKNLEGIFDIDSGQLLKGKSTMVGEAVSHLDDNFSAAFPNGVEKENFNAAYFTGPIDSLAVINYTSGSTGMSKGVMLTYRNLLSNAVFAVENIPFFQPGDGIVSMLPLAHMFGMLVELIFPLLKGCHITFLGRVPSPKILLDAFAIVKPKLVITVPLVIEKIVRSKIFPIIEKPAMKVATAIPGLNKIIYLKIRQKMIDAFGGNLVELIIGGAALSPTVEKFLRKIKFPYTVGYGMTECAPLISYCWWADQKPGSCGKIVDRMEAKIDSPDPESTPGVLWVKGDNVMSGYYKNPEATDAAFRDGWMNTGDICLLDPDGYLFIKGRDKSMILGPSGQNIYPEEIENKLNNLPFVAESVVVDRDGKIVAIVYPDFDAAEKARLSKEKIDELMDFNLTTLNRQLPAYSHVSRLELRQEPFEKTPKHSIKRFLYS